VVKDTKDKFSDRSYKVRKLLYGVNESFDIIVMTPDEIKDKEESNNFFIEDIVKKGKVLYEKK